MTYPRNQTILLAEDDRSAREVSTMVLEAEGYRVLGTSNGTKALETLLRDATIDLLLSDIHMSGGIDGIELAHRAQTHRPMRIMLISADPRDSFANFPENVAFLAKPYDRRSLLEAVHGALRDTEET